MNTQAINSYQPRADAFGKAIAARLSEGAEDLPHDISERLKAARAQALSKRKIASTQIAQVGSVSGGEMALQFGGHEDGFWSRMFSLLSLLALVVGLVSIAVSQDEERAQELAEVDAELLTDELPPSAYVDPGFAQYLRANQSNR
jgi:dienelactone hydrolase